MNKETHIYQHYIPECYLKNFTLDNKSIFVYRKNNNGKIFSKSISNIAGKKRLYDVDERFLLEEFKGKNKFIEIEIFANCFEPILSKLLEKLKKLRQNLDKNKIQNNVLNKIERDYFAELIAVQYIRHPNFIENYWNFYKNMYLKRNDIISSFFTKINPKSEPNNRFPFEFDERYSSALHSKFILDEDWRRDIQNQLARKIWIFYYTDNVVLTSDNPILLKPHIKASIPFYEGFGQKGVEIIFPINKNIILSIIDEEYFHDKKHLDNTIQSLNDKKLREYNLYQYFFSNFEIYSSSNNFEIVSKFLKMNNGEDFFSQRKKIQVY